MKEMRIFLGNISKAFGCQFDERRLIRRTKKVTAASRDNKKLGHLQRQEVGQTLQV